MNVQEFSQSLTVEDKERFAVFFTSIGADEGSIWLLDKDSTHLVIAHNSGPAPADLIGKLKQPLSEGIISLVYALEQSMIENEIEASDVHSRIVDETLSQTTTALLATPLYFHDKLQGVVSGVQLVGGKALRKGFAPQSLNAIRQFAVSVQQCIEQRDSCNHDDL